MTKPEDLTDEKHWVSAEITGEARVAYLPITKEAFGTLFEGGSALIKKNKTIILRALGKPLHDIVRMDISQSRDFVLERLRLREVDDSTNLLAAWIALRQGPKR